MTRDRKKLGSWHFGSLSLGEARVHCVWAPLITDEDKDGDDGDEDGDDQDDGGGGSDDHDAGLC